GPTLVASNEHTSGTHTGPHPRVVGGTGTKGSLDMVESTTTPAPLTVGVIGAGKVGAVLAARLRAAGHTITAAAGESDASRSRAAALLPGVPLAKPSAVARGCDLLLLTVPDDMLPNVVRVLADSGSLRAGQ